MRKFNLPLNAAKNTDYVEKWFKQKLFGIKFPTKKAVGAYVYLLKEWNKGLQRFAFWKYYNVLKRENSL